MRVRRRWSVMRAISSTTRTAICFRSTPGFESGPRPDGPTTGSVKPTRLKPRRPRGVSMLSLSELKDLARERWYYEIELADGLTTDGERHGNIAVVREFLRRVDLRGATCLDIGTQECVAPVLMMRQGAAHVDAYDRRSLENRYMAVK